MIGESCERPDYARLFTPIKKRNGDKRASYCILHDARNVFIKRIPGITDSGTDRRAIFIVTVTASFSLAVALRGPDNRVLCLVVLARVYTTIYVRTRFTILAFLV